MRSDDVATPRRLLPRLKVAGVLVLWYAALMGVNAAFGDLAVLESIEAMGAPFHYPAASGSSPRGDDEPVFVVCKYVVDGDFKRVVSKVPATSHVL